MSEAPHNLFALVATDLILLPSPSSAKVEPYRDLFRRLHEDVEFCQTAFGTGWPARKWSDEGIEDILQKDAKYCWAARGMGDFALGFLTEEQQTLIHGESSNVRTLQSTDEQVKIVDGVVFGKLFLQDGGQLLKSVNWAGYTCVRDAKGEESGEESGEKQPHWLEMIEVRYGLSPNFRGRGVITRAQGITMRWSVEELGVRRFIGEAQKHNPKSARVLERLGLHKADTNYFHDENAQEWQSDLQEQIA